MPTKLIADSGSSKTDWVLIHNNRKYHYSSKGLNPYFLDLKSGKEILENELKLKIQKEDIQEIYFYGAGVKSPKNKKLIERILGQHFVNSTVFCYSDMLGAARAACQNEKGVISILGTGSNSCYYDGSKITKQQASLGYVIGDEGSGTYLGKIVLKYFFYNTFDDELKEAFSRKFGNDLPAVLEKVYSLPFPNRYIAEFTSFLSDHRNHYMVENILEDAFSEFFSTHILKYRGSWKYPLQFVGSIAFTFKDVILNIAGQYGLTIGGFIQKPIDGLVEFHK
ncbi:MAG TPA: BadF/BadG/BcrA/BcrD ATPase family protein [Edaphocola sp.]|nr:BadF/BadG/BcrA/BcrD ATPase family protein [Edaphocola sp.]